MDITPLEPALAQALVSLLENATPSESDAEEDRRFLTHLLETHPQEEVFTALALLSGRLLSTLIPRMGLSAAAFMEAFREATSHGSEFRALLGSATVEETLAALEVSTVSYHVHQGSIPLNSLQGVLRDEVTLRGTLTTAYLLFVLGASFLYALSTLTDSSPAEVLGEVLGA